MDPTKVTGVAEWPTLKNWKEVQSFLGFTNFYRRFIPHFSDDARPLFDLSKKDVAFRWGIPEDEAFNKLKKSITATPILTLPSDNQPFRNEADGSGVATGAVLSQLSSEDGTWHPVSFLSKSLLAVECNYKIYDVEMVTVMHALRNGDTTWKAPNTLLKFGQTTKTWNISGLPKNSTGAKLGGLYSSHALTSPSTTNPVGAWANQTPSLREQTTAPDRRTTTTSPSSPLNSSRSAPSPVLTPPEKNRAFSETSNAHSRMESRKKPWPKLLEN